MPIKISRTAVLSLLAMIVILVVMALFKDELQPQVSPAQAKELPTQNGLTPASASVTLPDHP